MYEGQLFQFWQRNFMANVATPKFYTIQFEAQIPITLVAPIQISKCPFKIVLVGTFACREVD